MNHFDPVMYISQTLNLAIKRDENSKSISNWIGVCHTARLAESQENFVFEKSIMQNSLRYCVILWWEPSSEPFKSNSCLVLASGGKLGLLLLDFGPLFLVIAYEHSLFSFQQREHLGSSPSHRTFRKRQSSQALLERLRLQARGSSTMKSNDMSLSV
jgi:hypothetical protein